MKRRLTGATFDASAKTITHAEFSDVGLAGIQLITNVTDNIIVYNFADTSKGGTLSTDTLTLEYNTTSMSDSDELMILVEDGTTGGITQYTEGDTDASITGNAIMFESPNQSDTLEVVSGDNPLPVSIESAGVPITVTGDVGPLTQTGPSNALLVSSSAPTTVCNGKVTVATAGTPEPLAGSTTSVQGVVVQASSDNNGVIYVGDSSVDSTNGFELVAGQSIGLAIDDLDKVYVDASANGLSVTFLGS